MLHVIDHLPIESTELEYATIGDTIVLTENAIYAVKQNNEFHDLFKKVLKNLNCFVLDSDLQARGVETRDIVSGVGIIDEIDYKDTPDANIAELLAKPISPFVRQKS